MIVASKIMAPLLKAPLTRVTCKRNIINSTSSHIWKFYNKHTPKDKGGIPGFFSSDSIVEFCSFYLVFPIIIWARIHSYYVMKAEAHESVLLLPRYEYLNINKQRLPWRDGQSPLFGWPRGRDPAEYAANLEAGAGLPDRVDDDIEEEEEPEFDWDVE